MIVLGIGLLLIWLAGVSTHSAGWLSWLDFVAGATSLLIGAFRPAEVAPATRFGMPLALAIGLFVIWLIGLGVGSPHARVWWTFAFACAYLLVALSVGTPARQTTRVPPRAAT
jgi:hypothetical protein